MSWLLIAHSIGSFPERNDWEKDWRVTSSVSKKTDYLLLGEDLGSIYKKAGGPGVEINTEEDLLR